MSVTVPVNSNYDPNLMQASPQMSHASLSPRPGSSTGMLDMTATNGYPGSTSPIPTGGAPSPGLLSRPHSSKTHSPTRPNLRVLIPNSQPQAVSINHNLKELIIFNWLIFYWSSSPRY